MKELNEFSNKMLIRNYRGLDIALFEAIKLYKPDRDENQNID